MKRARVTLRDVARRLEVHPSTVSRVLNPKTRGMVTEDVARRVIAAADEMGYRPNPFALSLKTNRSYIVGVLIPDLTNPLFPPIIRGVERTLAEAGYTVILANSDNQAERERRNLGIFRERQVDGLVVATAHREDDLIAATREDDIPLVLVNRATDDPETPWVINDDAVGIRQVVDHLAGLGHAAIAHLAGPQTLSTGHGRHRAFVEAMGEAGLVADDNSIAIASAFTEEEGRRAAAELLADGPPFTAIVAGNDLLALGCYDALQAAGKRCPDDVSVTGYNDMPFADKFAPPLTTVRIPHDEMGVMAARLLLERIEGVRVKTRSAALRPALIVRGSTARPPR